MSERQAVLTVADLEKMTPQQRTDAIRASLVSSLDEVSETFVAEIQETAKQLGEQRRARA